MEAHHGRREGFNHIGHRMRKRHTPRPGGDVMGVDTRLLVQPRQGVAPTRLRSLIGWRRCVAKKVDVPRPDGLVTQDRQLCTQSLWAEHGAGQRTHGAGLAHGQGQGAAL